MPIFDYCCNECDYVEEIMVGAGVQNFVPSVCPKCEKGKLERQFSPQGQSFDVVGGYSYQYGKKSYTKLPAEKRADFLVKDANGKYKDPY